MKRRRSAKKTAKAARRTKISPKKPAKRKRIAKKRKRRAVTLPPLERCVAVVVARGDSGLTPRLTEIKSADLRAGAPADANVTLRVLYSTMNYKDGLALAGHGEIVKKFPHVPGVDLAGIVEDSADRNWKRGDMVVAGGFRMGELYWGGFSQRARVKGSWLVPLPRNLTPLRAMAIGTAGLTSALAVMALEEHALRPESGEILVTGAAGGVGSVAVALLAALGFKVAAVTGREETHRYLKRLGAATIIPRGEFAAKPDRPLQTARFAGAIDAVGGVTLANILARLQYGGSVAATGLVGGRELVTTVIPFLLRGVNLLGIEATNCPVPRRMAAWDRLARDLPMKLLDEMTTIVPLAQAPEIGRRILEGKVQGRVVIDVNA